MDPWSKGGYSRYIREASMAMDGLPEGVPPSGRVPGQLLQEAPILKRRRQRYRGEFPKVRSILGVSTPRAKYRRRGGTGGTHEAVRRVPDAAQGGAAPPALLAAWWWPSFAALVIPKASGSLIFLSVFSGFFGALLMAGKPEIQKLQKTSIGSWVHWVNRFVQICSKVNES